MLIKFSFLLLNALFIYCQSEYSLKKISLVDSTLKYRGNVFHLKEFDVYSISESDVKKIESNCSNTIEVHLTLTIQNSPTSVIGYLHKNGHIDEKLIMEDCCKRTKSFEINETHVMLYFGQIYKVVPEKEISKVAMDFLWTYDKSHYVLSYMLVYDELENEYVLAIIMMVFFN